MALSAEWRTASSGDTILIVSEGARVRAACQVTLPVLRKFLTDLGDLEQWVGDQPVESEPRSPEAWGSTVLSRAHSGEVLTVDPELFWDLIYRWFRSRGVDYDGPDDSIAPSSSTWPGPR
jgi:hypothetical protein